jgi:putative transposase
MPLINSAIEGRIFPAILGRCRELHAEPLAISAMPDHLHLLVRLPTTLSVAELVKEIKGMSSHLVTHEVGPGDFFKWQGAYGAFTVGKQEVSAVRNYIDHQRQHHASRTVIPEWEQTATEEPHTPGE